MAQLHLVQFLMETSDKILFYSYEPLLVLIEFLFLTFANKS